VRLRACELSVSSNAAPGELDATALILSETQRSEQGGVETLTEKLQIVFNEREAPTREATRNRSRSLQKGHSCLRATLLPRHPSWYLNLLENPEVHVQVGTEKFLARARYGRGAAETVGADDHHILALRELPEVDQQRDTRGDPRAHLTVDEDSLASS
jgi:hypothetical protein